MAAPASRQELLSAWASALAEKGAVLEADEADAFLEVVAAPPGAKANDADLAGPPTGSQAALLPLATFIRTAISNGADDQIVSQAKQSLLEGWNSLAEPGEAPVQWELSLQDATSLLDMLTSLEQEGILEVEEQAAVSSALRAILCDAVPQLAAVIASASDLVGLRGQAAMHAALMQCTINCAATRTGSHKLPLLTDDIKAVLQTACDALQDMGVGQSAKSAKKGRNPVHQELVMGLAEKLLLAVYSTKDAGVGDDWQQLLLELLRLSQSQISSALKSLEWAVGDSSASPTQPSGDRSDPTGVAAALAVPAAAYASALLCRQSGADEDAQQQVPYAINLFTSLAEACMRAVWTLGIDSQTSAQLLALAKLVVLQVKTVVAAFLVAGGPVVNVPVSRLRGLIISASQLMQLADVPPEEWDWNIESQCLASSYEGGYPATALCRAAVQTLVEVMEACWRSGHETAVKSLLLPGLDPKRPVGPESTPLCIMVGRLSMAVQGEEKLSRIVLPLLIDRLVTYPRDRVFPALLSRILHTLGKIAGAAAHNNDRWAFDQVLALLVKLYKEPGAATSQYLMHSGQARSEGSVGPAQPGGLADVLTVLGSSLAGAPVAFAEHLLHQLLSLFCDFGLTMVSSKAAGPRKGHAAHKLPADVAADLAELLPAIAATCEQVAPEAGEPDAAQDPTATFDKLANELKEDEARTQMYRILWLYSCLLGLTPVPVAYKWEGASEAVLSRREAWRQALGRIACHTTPLLMDSGRGEQEILVDIKTRLQKLGSAGQSSAIYQGLTSVWGMPGSGRNQAGSLPLNAASSDRNAYLLTVTGMELTRASTSMLQRKDPASHMAALMQHLHRKGASDYVYLKAATGAVFECYLQRVRHHGERAQLASDADTQAGREALAGVLVSNLQVPGGNTEVSQVAEVLLHKLLTACPALLWSRAVVRHLVAMPMPPGSNTPVARTVERWVASSLKWAPMAAEAALHEEMRGVCMPHSHMAHGTTATRLLSGFASPRAQSYPTGLHALGQKLHYSGIVSGLKASVGLSGGASSSCELVVDMLEKAATADCPTSHLKECYLQAVALLVEDGHELDRADYFQLLRMLAWVPDKFMDPEIVTVATFGLTWISIGAPHVTAAMLSEVANMWITSANKKVGIFSGSTNASTEAPSPELLRRIEAQQLLLGFMEEHWAITTLGALNASGAALVVFRRFLELSLQQPSRLLVHPCCTSAYFRLLTLGLRFCRRMWSASRSASLQVPVLFGRLLLAALHWFTRAPTFYQHAHDAANGWSAEAVQTFASILEAVQPLSIASGVNSEGHTRLPLGLQSAEEQRDRVALLTMLLKHEVERLQVWASPLQATAGPAAKPAKASAAPLLATRQGHSPAVWAKFTATAWDVDPQLALALMERFPTISEVESKSTSLVVKHAHTPAVQALPAAAQLLAKHCVSAPDARDLLEHLSTWACSDLVTALFLLTGPEAANAETRAYALRSLYACEPEDVAFYLPQLVQGLRNDKAGDLKEYLKAAAARSYIFCHRLVWNLQSEERPPSEALDPEVKRSGWEPPKDTGLWNLVNIVKDEVLAGLSAPDKDYLEREFAFFDDVTKISGYLAKYEKAERPFRIGGYLQQVRMRGNDLYLPTNVDSRVLKLMPDSGTPMQSAAKVPILVAFEVESIKHADHPTSGDSAGEKHVQACIFKVGDDCRQDVMSLQVIDLLKQRFQSVGLPLYLVPYGVLPTGYECGIIEVVPNSASRASLGETSESGLIDIFRREFGAPGSQRFEDARDNFIKSSAGYAVASFLLQAKDRHNGNILLDTQGHLVHIDFGFVLEISPGNNMRFESAAFKLSHEMCQLLDPGGQRTSPSFKMFEELCIKGYLAARTNVDAIMAAVSLMLESGLPCFGHGEPLKNLYARFHMERTDKQAAEFMRATIADAYDKWTTRFYDVIQWYQQGIEK